MVGVGHPRAGEVGGGTDKWWPLTAIAVLGGVGHCCVVYFSVVYCSVV